MGGEVVKKPIKNNITVTRKPTQGETMLIHEFENLSIMKSMEILDLEKVKKGEIKDLREANLWGAYLWGADLRRADLRGADLQKAKLQKAKLQKADLRGADLWRANLVKADLRGADFRGANLHGAKLRNADLREAKLQEADLWNADLWNALLPNTDRFLNNPYGVCHIRENSIRIGCEYHSVEAWKGFTDEEINKMDPGALEWWKGNKEIVMFIAENLKKKGE